MGLLSPIGTLTLFAGSAGVLELYPTPATYHPGGTTDYQAPTPTTLNVSGVFSKADMAGVEVIHDAIYMIDLRAVPVGLLPQKSRCIVNGEDYLVMNVDQRWYLAELDGLTLHLKV